MYARKSLQAGIAYMETLPHPKDSWKEMDDL